MHGHAHPSLESSKDTFFNLEGLSSHLLLEEAKAR